MDMTNEIAPQPMKATLWSNFGHKRLYVTQGEHKLGWVDLKTGSLQMTSEIQEATLRGFIDAWTLNEGIQWPPEVPEDSMPQIEDQPAREAPVRAAPAKPPVIEPIPATETPLPGTTVPEATDLSLNKAGAAAQAVADELLVGVSRFRRFLHALFNIHTDARAWAKGAEGERLVAAQFERLAPEWRALHAVIVGSRGSDIDHVLIGPAGVITVNAKNHWGGKVWVGGNGFMVNGAKQPYVRNSRHEAARAAKLLTAACGFEVPTTALISVVVSAGDLNIKAQPDDGVRVTHYKSAHRWITKLPVQLTPAQVEAVYAAARISTTWT